MPENKETITSEVDLDINYSAADAANDVEEEPSTEAENEEEKPEAPESEVIPDLPADEEAKGDEDEDESDDDLPQLDAKAKEAIGDNPAALEAWERAWKGVKKREDKLAASEQHYSGLVGVEQALSDPAHAKATLRAIIDATAKHLGKTAEELLGADNSSTSTGEFEYASDAKLYQKAVTDAKAQAKAEIMDALGIDPKDLQGLVKERNSARQAEAMDKWADTALPVITNKAAKEVGWNGVTKQMILEAAKDYPALIKSDPLKALKKTFPDEYAASRQKVSKKLPDMLDSSNSVGHTNPVDPLDYTAAHAMRDIA